MCVATRLFCVATRLSGVCPYMDVLCFNKIVWCVSLQECPVFQNDCLLCVATRMFCVSIRLSGVCRYMDVLCIVFRCMNVFASQQRLSDVFKGDGRTSVTVTSNG